MNIDEIASIEDVAERGSAAGAAARKLHAQSNTHRVARNNAMLALLAPPYQWKKTAIVKHVGVSRSMFVGVVKTAPAALPPVRGDAAKVAADEHAKVLALSADVARLRAIRDDAAHSMLFGEHPRPNHEVAKIIGEKQERVAQLRRDALSM